MAKNGSPILITYVILYTPQREKTAAEEEAEEEKDRLVKLISEADESTNAKLTRGPRFRAASHEVFFGLASELAGG